MINQNIVDFLINGSQCIIIYVLSASESELKRRSYRAYCILIMNCRACFVSCESIATKKSQLRRNRASAAVPPRGSSWQRKDRKASDVSAGDMLAAPLCVLFESAFSSMLKKCRFQCER